MPTDLTVEKKRLVFTNKMKKKELIASILEAADIHHNIRISYSKLSDIPDDLILEQEADGNDFISSIAQYMVEDFKDTFEDWKDNKINDTGNRNLGEACERKGQIWSYGRSGATLYWDAYWTGGNCGFVFNYYESELEDMAVDELKEIKKDVDGFNKQVSGLMDSFYEEVAYRIEEWTDEKKKEKAETLLYEKTLKTIKDNDFKRRIINDLID